MGSQIFFGNGRSLKGEHKGRGEYKNGGGGHWPPPPFFVFEVESLKD